MMAAADLAAQWQLRRSGSRREWRGTCPLCSYKAAFVLSEREGKPLAWCASCQDRAGLSSLMRGGAMARQRSPVLVDETAEEKVRRKQERARQIWINATALSGSIGAAYLAFRALAGLARSPALRFAEACRHPDGCTYPALVALVRDGEGEPVAVHRTFLRRDGHGKADVDPPRAALGPTWGGAIRLDPVAPEIVVGEGIETSASAGVLLGLPAWAAISSGNLAAALVLPPEVRSVVIAADPDTPGERDARAAAERWKAEGRKVRIAHTDRPGRDFNDILTGRAG
jgi:phage/plasmid primase-like uncharacterized protein